MRWTLVRALDGGPKTKYSLNESNLTPMNDALRNQVQAIRLLLSVLALYEDHTWYTHMKFANDLLA
jgi:hypothetical protein